MVFKTLIFQNVPFFRFQPHGKKTKPKPTPTNNDDREVDDWNTGAVKLYANYGYVKDETRKGTKIGRFVMKKDL